MQKIPQSKKYHLFKGQIGRARKGDPGSFTEFSNPEFSTEVSIRYSFKLCQLWLVNALYESRYCSDDGYDKMGQLLFLELGAQSGLRLGL